MAWLALHCFPSLAFITAFIALFSEVVRSRLFFCHCVTRATWVAFYAAASHVQRKQTISVADFKNKDALQ